MIDICTVVSGSDLAALRLQAQSVGKCCQNVGVRNIYVILNDAETVASKIDVSWWGDMASHVLVVPRSAFSAGWVDDQKITRQLWSLLCASMSYNVYTMMLNVGTVIVAPITLSSLFDANGRVGFARAAVGDHDKVELESLYSVAVPELLALTESAYFVHNDTVRFMISDTTVRARQSFAVWFQRAGVDWRNLYCAYMIFKYGNYDSFYNVQSQPNMVWIDESLLDRVDGFLDDMSTSHFVGVDPSVWPLLSINQKQRYRMLLIDHGIHRAWDYQG